MKAPDIPEGSDLDAADLLAGIDPLLDYLFGLSDEPPEGMAADNLPEGMAEFFREPEQGKDGS